MYETELHQAVRETLAENRPHDAVIGLITNGASCSAQNFVGLTPVELAVFLESGERLAEAMLMAECAPLPPVEAFKRIMVRGNLLLVQILMRQTEQRLGGVAAIDELKVAFAELKTHNVELSPDITHWIQYLLAENDYQRPACDRMGVDEREDRLRHLIECIEFVEDNYDNDVFSDMDSRFVLYIRQIFEHVFFLKNALKELPLMQLQFCLAIFLRGITGVANENNDIYNFILDKEIIIGFLKTTKNVLKNLNSVKRLSPQMYFECLHMSGKETVQFRIKKSALAFVRNTLTNDPELQTIVQIDHFDHLNLSQIGSLGKHCAKLQSDQQSQLYRKRFKRLLNTYYTAKQFYSVRKISSSIETISDLNLEDRASLPTSIAALKRSLQIIGEAVKSSKQTPNITKKLDSILHIFSAQSFVEITKDLRQFFSHGYSLAKQRLDRDCPLELFRSILKNLKSSGPWVSYVLFLQNVYVFRQYLGRLYRLPTIERMRSYVEFIGTELKARLQTKYEAQDVNEAILLVKYLIKECDDAQEQFKLGQISRLLTMHKNALNNDVASIGQLIDHFFFLEFYIRQDVASVEQVRTMVSYMLKNSRHVRRYKSADKSLIIWASNLILELRLSETNQKRKILLDEIWQRLVKQNVAGIESLQHQTIVGNDHCREETFKMLNEVGIAVDSIEFVEMVDRRLNNKYYQNLFDLNNKYHVLNEVIKDRRAGGQLKQFKEKLKLMRKKDEAYFQTKLDGIIDSLRSVLMRYGDPEDELSIQLSATDRYAVEYYLLEIGEILCSLGTFQDNLQSLKTSVPVITGRNLRNYLAHDQLAYDTLSEMPSAVEMNALYVLKNSFKISQKHTMHQKQGYFAFQDLFQYKLTWIGNQQELVNAIGNFNIAKLEQIASSCQISLLGRDTLNQDLISIALNNNPAVFITQLLRHSDADPNFFTLFLKHSTNYRLKQQINHLLTQPHQFCYATAIRFELIDQMIELRSHPEVNTNLHDKEVERIFSRYAVSSIRRLMNILPVEQLLRDNRLRNTILHWTVLRGDWDLVRYALARHRTLIDEINVFMETPLALAVRYGHTNIAQLLLEAGADVTVGTCSPLWIATTLGNTVMINHLLSKRAIANMDSNRLLNAALESNNLELFKTLHEEYNLNMWSHHSLHRAIQQGREEFVHYILQSPQESALVNSLDSLSFTPLITAAVCGQLHTTTTLLQHGSNPSFVNDYGYTPLHSAVHSTNRAIVATLLRQPGVNLNAVADDNVSAISLAIAQNDIKMMQFLLANGARVMAQQLIHAAYFNHYHIVRMLLDRDDNGLLHEAVDVAGRNLLVYAIINGNIPMVEFLLAKGINVNERTHGALTALHIAASKNQPAICDRLIEAGCDRDAIDEEGRTALIVALLQEFFTVANLLLARGANSDCVREYRFKSSRNATLLHKFAHENRVFMVCLLLDHSYRVDSSIADDNGDTALDYARERGNDEIISILSNRN